MENFSWTYYFHTHQKTGLIIALASVIFIYIPIIFFCVKVIDRPATGKWVKKLCKPLLYILFLPVLILPQQLLGKLQKGGITDFYISTNGNTARLIVWHTERASRGHLFSGYRQSLTFYDLSTGEQLDALKLKKPFSSINEMNLIRINDSLAMITCYKDTAYINFNNATLLTKQSYKQLQKESLPYNDYNRYAYTGDWKLYYTQNHKVNTC